MQSMKRDWLKCYEASDFTAFLELLSCYAFKPLTRPVGCVSSIAYAYKGNAAG